MARLEFFVVSQSIAVDDATNYVSVLEILEQIQVPSFPKVIPQCVAVSLWRKEAGDEESDFQLLLRITTPPDGVHEIRTNFRLTAPRHRVIQRIQGLPITGEGQLRFEAIINGQHAADHIIDVQQAGVVDTIGSPAQPN
jgi:hypothetical protein